MHYLFYNKYNLKFKKYKNTGTKLKLFNNLRGSKVPEGERSRADKPTAATCEPNPQASKGSAGLCFYFCPDNTSHIGKCQTKAQISHFCATTRRSHSSTGAHRTAG